MDLISSLLQPRIKGYMVLDVLHEGATTITFRAQSQLGGQKVIIKQLRSRTAASQDWNYLKDEYEIFQQLSSDGFLSPISSELDLYQEGLVFADVEGVPLAQYLADSFLDWQRVVPLGIQLAELLHHLYLNNIVHQALQPKSLLINPATQALTILDLSLGTPLSSFKYQILDPLTWFDDYTYLAPEQTGRIKRKVDSRTDLYALGLTLYELLVGYPPFTSCDSNELLHCHLAKKPKPLHIIDPEIPLQISKIISKLLEKNPEARYQSAIGLKEDLKRCLDDWQWKELISLFPLAQKDISDQFKIPHRLYSREKELDSLLHVWEKVRSGHAELVLVDGFSGIGKNGFSP